MIYLDHNATTPVEPEVLELMCHHIQNTWHNPSGLYMPSQMARSVIEESRNTIAELLNAHSSEIYFTSSGTEGDNMLIKGICRHGNRGNKHIVISDIEHPAVIEAAESMRACGCDIDYVKPGRSGIISMSDICRAIRDDTVLLSLMHANNEVGTVQNIEEAGALCRERGIVFHTDAVQTVGKLPLDLSCMPVDILTASAHKFYGPRGIGFIYIRRGTTIEPLLSGGGQEGGMRASTENTAAIAGMALALEIACERYDDEKRLTCLREKLFALIRSETVSVKRNPEIEPGFPSMPPLLGGTLNITLPGVNAQALAMALDMAGVAVSTGSACSAGIQSPSRTLLAMGCSREECLSSIRISIGRYTREEEIERAAELIAAEAGRLLKNS